MNEISAPCAFSPIFSATALAARVPPEDVRVMTYNIHQGFDARPSPTAPAIADVIEEANADLVALQEVNRGANIAGGADLVAYLRWRFPDHHVVFAPSYTNVMGNAIISRYPTLNWGWAHYPPPADDPDP